MLLFSDRYNLSNSVFVLFNRKFDQLTEEESLEENLSYLEGKLSPGDFIAEIAAHLHEMKEYELLDILNKRKYISDRYLNKHIQTCGHDIPVHQGAANYQTGGLIGTNRAANQTGNSGTDCVTTLYVRAEMESRQSCSFDNNVDTNVWVRQATQPRPELQNVEQECPEMLSAI